MSNRARCVFTLKVKERPLPPLIWNKVDQPAAMFESQFRKNHFTVYHFKFNFFTFMFQLGINVEKEMKNNSTR